MLTEALIKPFIEALEGDGVEDTTTYEYGFRAGMAALSDILSENIDNQPQLFVYLGMAISEGMQWVKSLVSESPEKLPSTKFNYVTFPPIDDPRWETPSAHYLGCECYGINFEGEFIKGKLNIAIAGNFILETERVFGNGVSKIIPLESPNESGEKRPTPSSDLEPEFDFIPSLDTPANFMRKYKSQTVIYKEIDDLRIEKTGNMVLSLDQNELILICCSTGNQVKKPYYVRLK